jgi:hypothetical protein
MLPVRTQPLASWPNPVAQTFGAKCLQNGNFMRELVYRPHESDGFTSRDRLIERWEVERGQPSALPDSVNFH